MLLEKGQRHPVREESEPEIFVQTADKPAPRRPGHALLRAVTVSVPPVMQG